MLQMLLLQVSAANIPSHEKFINTKILCMKELYIVTNMFTMFCMSLATVLSFVIHVNVPV